MEKNMENNMGSGWILQGFRSVKNVPYIGLFGALG